MHEHEPIVIAETSHDNLAIDWLGCRFIVDDEGSDSSELKPTSCDVTLQDGRIAELTIGRPENWLAMGTTIAVLYADPVGIDVVARVAVGDTFYAPCYFRFEAGSP